MSCSSAGVARLWQEICREIIARSSDTAYNVYFKDVVPLECDDTELQLGISEEFTAEWIMDNYSDVLDEAVSAVCGSPRKVIFEFGYMPEHVDVQMDLQPELFQDAEEETCVEAAETAPVMPVSAAPVHRTAEKCLEENTFENFVVGEENRYAYTAATSTVQAPGRSNPLYIFGGSGMGKTHLIQAIANDVASRHPEAVIRYTTCEEFLNEYVASLKSKTDFRFRDRFRNVDYLLVDDIHFLGGKVQIQEEFFNTFNALCNSKKQIILTSDKPPTEIRGLEKRLVSRFQAGMTMQITESTFETRLAILRQMQEGMPNRFSDAVLNFLASRIRSNIRPLKSALLRLSFFASAGTEITVESAEALLADVLDKEAEEKSLHLSTDAIQKAVAEYFELQVRDLTAKKRPANVAAPRMLAMYLCRKLTDCTQQEIGLAFGGRNHATVHHAFKTIEDKIKTDEGTRRAISTIQRSLQY